MPSSVLLLSTAGNELETLSHLFNDFSNRTTAESCHVTFLRIISSIAQSASPNQKLAPSQTPLHAQVVTHVGRLQANAATEFSAILNRKRGML